MEVVVFVPTIRE